MRIKNIPVFLSRLDAITWIQAGLPRIIRFDSFTFDHFDHMQDIPLTGFAGVKTAKL